MLDPEQLRRALAARPLRRLPQGALNPAAVLVPLHVRAGEEWLFFTRRTEEMPHHRGEISFPGGRRHPEDADLLATALRETEEEMGIRAADVTVLGRLDDFESVYGYHVVPFVGLFPWPYPWRINRREIAEVIEAPLERLRDPANWRVEDWQHRGRHHPVHFCTIDGQVIWGLTAAILRQFLRRLPAPSAAS